MKNSIYILDKPYHFTVNQKEINSPEEGYLTLKFEYCGICGGDYSCFLGRRNNYPMTLGHEFVATVIEPDINHHYKVGDVVVSDLNYRCKSCVFCNSQRSHLCIHNSDGLFTNRGFAQYGNIHINYLYTIPQIEWLPRACFIEPLSCVIHACNMLDIKKNSHILIVGAGSIGSMFAFYLTSHYHCKKVEITDIVYKKAENLIKCFSVHELNNKNEKYDLVVDCSNELEGTISALNFAGVGGRICIMSHLYGLNTSLIYDLLCKKEIDATFPLRNGDVSNIKQAIKYISNLWCSDYDCLIHIYDDINKAFSEKKEASWNKQVIRFHH